MADLPFFSPFCLLLAPIPLACFRSSQALKQTCTGAVWRLQRRSALVLLLLLGVASHVVLADTLSVPDVEHAPVLAETLTTPDVEHDLSMYLFDSDVSAHEVMAQEMVLVQEAAPPAPQDILNDVGPPNPVYKSFKKVDRTSSIPERILPVFEDFER